MVERKDTEENLDDVSPIETGLTFDKWLAQKLRVKRIQKELKKKEAQLITNEYATKLNHFCVELKLYIQLNQNKGKRRSPKRRWHLPVIPRPTTSG